LRQKMENSEIEKGPHKCGCIYERTEKNIIGRVNVLPKEQGRTSTAVTEKSRRKQDEKNYVELHTKIEKSSKILQNVGLMLRSELDRCMFFLLCLLRRVLKSSKIQLEG